MPERFRQARLLRPLGRATTMIHWRGERDVFLSAPGILLLIARDTIARRRMAGKMRRRRALARPLLSHFTSAAVAGTQLRFEAVACLAVHREVLERVHVALEELRRTPAPLLRDDEILAGGRGVGEDRAVGVDSDFLAGSEHAVDWMRRQIRHGG